MLKKLIVTALLSVPLIAMAQTDIDAIMMEKNAFCVGPSYTYSSWKNYWEGTLKRENLNLGNVSTQMYGLMGTYGITKRLNVLFMAPYVQTKASAGTLHSQKGIQDLSLFVKYVPYRKKIGDGIFTVFAIGGFSTPLSNYVADYLPLSIGLHSTNLMGRAMADYQMGNFFATLSGTYVYRNNIKIDRTSYYTTEEHDTRDVEMPDVATFNFRAGLRTYHLIAEAVVNKMKTLGGFDITRNNMPFPSNRMNAITAGVNFKYTPAFAPKLSIVAGGNYVLKGRNVGQAYTIDGAIFYVLNFGHKEKKTTNNNKTK
ncbi:MAG: hypothetical protein QM764_04180 [Chitinophagaceae bacterium]